MRARRLLIAIALAVLALAGFRHDGEHSPEPQHCYDSSTHVAPQPAPAPEPPAIVRAAVTASATAQKDVASKAYGHERPAHESWRAIRQAPAEPGYDLSRPRSFPLLI